MSSPLRDRVRSDEPTVGTFVSLGSVLAAETCALAGFDWLVVDLEHGGGGEDALVGQILAAGIHQVPVIVRVETAERIRSGRVLDLGAAGVMFPRLDSAEEVATAVRHLRYPPQGDRGVATYNRACAFGMRPDSVDTANDKVVGVVQIESAGALAEVDAIAEVPGVDVLFVGPADLSHALGVPGMFESPEFGGALIAVVRAAQSARISAGILVPDRDRALQCVEAGFTFVAIASDSALLASAASAAAFPLKARAEAVANR
jgi:2-dehydro-3-deoxyglucarate aldolase/4-hydroxy-2-oxoheptanedioate aldolase